MCGAGVGVTANGKLQALVYDILPPTSAIINYAMDLSKQIYIKIKLSADGQFFVGAPIAVRL